MCRIIGVLLICLFCLSTTVFAKCIPGVCVEEKDTQVVDKKTQDYPRYILLINGTFEGDTMWVDTRGNIRTTESPTVIMAYPYKTLGEAVKALNHYNGGADLQPDKVIGIFRIEDSNKMDVEFGEYIKSDKVIGWYIPSGGE